MESPDSIMGMDLESSFSIFEDIDLVVKLDDYLEKRVTHLDSLIQDLDKDITMTKIRPDPEKLSPEEPSTDSDVNAKIVRSINVQKGNAEKKSIEEAQNSQENLRAWERDIIRGKAEDYETQDDPLWIVKYDTRLKRALMYRDRPITMLTVTEVSVDLVVISGAPIHPST
ncbi:hypothetical protein MMC25_005278 [Agyrium rufum]|nr:hypothetical protein [Agyrium rufum]